MEQVSEKQFLFRTEKGIFGTPIGAYGCTEEQARGSLHMHLLFWGSLPPTLLQAAGGITTLTYHISRAIDQMVTAYLQPTIHVKHLPKDMKNEKVPPAAIFKPHHPTEEKELFIQDYERSVDLSNIHQHVETCFKTKTGKRCCRLGRPVKLRRETGCEQIVATNTSEDEPEITFKVLDSIEPPKEATTTKRNFSAVPVALRDKRLIMHYLKRPKILPTSKKNRNHNI